MSTHGLNAPRVPPCCAGVCPPQPAAGSGASAAAAAAAPPPAPRAQRSAAPGGKTRPRSPGQLGALPAPALAPPAPALAEPPAPAGSAGERQPAGRLDLRGSPLRSGTTGLRCGAPAAPSPRPPGQALISAQGERNCWLLLLPLFLMLHVAGIEGYLRVQPTASVPLSFAGWSSSACRRRQHPGSSMRPFQRRRQPLRQQLLLLWVPRGCPLRGCRLPPPRAACIAGWRCLPTFLPAGRALSWRPWPAGLSA